MDSLTIFIREYSGYLRFGLSVNFHFGGSILGHLRFGLYDNFHFGGNLGHLGFGLYDNFHLGGVFWDTLDLDSLNIFILGGILEHLGLESMTISFEGVFWDTLDLDSMTIFIFGGYSGTPWIWTL